MDNLTHSLVGAVLGQAGLKRRTGLGMAALVIGANLPDVDAACFFWLEGTEHLAFRRGITHGPPAWVLLPLVLAGALWWFDRWQEKRGKRPEDRLPVHFGWLYALAFIGCLSHPALDWLNVYGIRLLEPFSSQWFYGDTLFIIDPWLWALLIGSLWWSRRREKRGGEWRRPAQLGIAAMLAYIALNGWISFAEALRVRSNDMSDEIAVIASPVPLTFWKREGLVGGNGTWLVVRDQSSSDQPVMQEGGGATETAQFFAPIAEQMCKLPDFTEARRTNSQLDAFLFWSRAPFAVRADDGSVILYDARFYDPRARDRFSVALPQVKCEELARP
ncbi:MAG: metal-dependent hydrolase [Erythrobacter sp.]|jgi:inner membrane protein|nr:metal-dependent hydrolase [Erythrobacter sp.]